jgi:hypothetical protein
MTHDLFIPPPTPARCLTVEASLADELACARGRITLLERQVDWLVETLRHISVVAEGVNRDPWTASSGTARAEFLAGNGTDPVCA